MSKRPKPSSAPGGNSSDPKSRKIVAPGKSPVLIDKPLDLEIVPTDADLDRDTPALDGAKSVYQVNTFSVEECETAIAHALAASEEHRRQSAIWDLRAGILLQIYRQSLKVNGRKFTGFWARAEERFRVTRGTISKKMRLAAIWAKENGASPEQQRELAEAADLTDTSLPAVQLAFDWIGERTTTDLYREHGLVSYGPQGGDLSAHRTGKRRTKDEIVRDDFEACAPALCVVAQTSIDKLLAFKGPKGEPAVCLLDDAALERLTLAAHDLHAICVETRNRRKRLK
jgi:hypothetical protein